MQAFMKVYSVDRSWYPVMCEKLTLVDSNVTLLAMCNAL